MTHAYYRFYAYVRPEGLRSSWNRDRIVAELNALGVPAFQGSCSEVYLEKAFDGSGLQPANRLPVARELGETSLAFLTHPTLTGDDVARTCAAIERIFSEAAT
jgi:dTDP-4-amino-4,6-dideoxygalactose transaminase